MQKNNLGSKIFLTLVSIYLLVPFIVTLIYSLSTEWTSIVPTGFTLKNYVELFQDADFWLSTGRTLLICVVSVTITIVLLLLAMYVVLVEIPQFGKYMQIVCMIPYALQGVILSISIISLYSGTGTILSNRMFMLFGAYTILVLPYIYQGIRNNMNALNANILLQAAQMLGCGKFMAYVRIVIPNILSGIIVSSLLAVSIIFGDFVLANNIAGNNYKNIQVYLYQMMTKSSGMSSAVVVLIFCVVFMISGTVIHLESKSKKGEK
ncbi:MAG: spermidine/putrescine ABC transporter [Eubacteriales bacterium]